MKITKNMRHHKPWKSKMKKSFHEKKMFNKKSPTTQNGGDGGSVIFF